MTGAVNTVADGAALVGKVSGVVLPAAFSNEGKGGEVDRCCVHCLFAM